MTEDENVYRILGRYRRRTDGRRGSGMMMPYGRDPMKTQVGKSIHKLGVAVDHAVDSIVSEMRDAQGGEPRLSAFFDKIRKCQ